MNRVVATGLGLFWAALGAASGQAVSNIRVDVDSQRVKILYDVAGLAGPDSVFVRVENPAGPLPATTVTGDVGRGVMPGLDKTIFWDYRLDGVAIGDSIRVTVLVKRPAPLVSRPVAGGGPANALLSALLPGVGTILVQPARKIGARPLISAAYVGLLAYGFNQRSRSRAAFGRYETGFAEADYQDANQRHHRYLLATRTAAALWLADVAYTFLKGRNNDRLRRMAVHRVAVRFTNGAPTVGLELRL